MSRSFFVLLMFAIGVIVYLPLSFACFLAYILYFGEPDYDTAVGMVLLSFGLCSFAMGVTLYGVYHRYIP